jgi:type IV pilus assembly protein PilA
MFKALRARLNPQDHGFTLIELMVVVLIMAILIAMAIPTFLGARKRAQDKQAQSHLRNAMTTEKTHYADNGVYTNDPAVLKGLEPALDWTQNDASKRGVIVVALLADGTTLDQGVVLETKSKSGVTFCVADMQTGLSAGTYYNRDAAGGPCPLWDSGWPQSTDAWK